VVGEHRVVIGRDAFERCEGGPMQLDQSVWRDGSLERLTGQFVPEAHALTIGHQDAARDAPVKALDGTGHLAERGWIDPAT
jgi:hypothetical protein